VQRFGMEDATDLGLTPEGDASYEMWSLLRDN